MAHKIDPPAILEVMDASAGLKGWLAVDSIVDHHFCGGLRMLPDVSPEELADLAKAMTLKHAFLGLPHGGAKAGIVYDERTQAPEKSRLLAAFGRIIRDLLKDRVYLPGSDMGTNGEDIRGMLRSAGIRIPKRALFKTQSGWYTSLTVVAGAKAAAESLGLDLAKATVAIEGFGAVGSAVAQGLRNLGCRVVAVSTCDGGLYAPDGFDFVKLLECYRQHGSRMVDHVEGAAAIPRESLLELGVDVLVPCARHHSIHAGNVGKIKARLISCGANVPATGEAEKILWQRGILCIPDFVANAGGVLGGTMEFAGIRPSAIAEFVDRNYSRQIAALIASARAEGAYIREKAEKMAAQRLARVRSAVESRSLKNGLFLLGLDLYRSGLVPSAVVGWLAWKYFRKRIEGKV